MKFYKVLGLFFTIMLYATMLYETNHSFSMQRYAEDNRRCFINSATVVRGAGGTGSFRANRRNENDDNVIVSYQGNLSMARGGVISITQGVLTLDGGGYGDFVGYADMSNLGVHTVCLRRNNNPGDNITIQFVVCSSFNGREVPTSITLNQLKWNSYNDIPTVMK